MFGFVLGTACLLGLAWMWRRRRYGYWGHGCGPWHHRRGRGSFGPGYGYGEPGGRFGPRRGFGPVAWLAHQLEATPDQAKVIRDEVEGFMEKTQGLRREVRLSRDDIAAALRGESFDEETMGESFARQDDRIREIREALVGALARIHDSLDERQRRRMADVLSHGPMNFHGPRWM